MPLRRRRRFPRGWAGRAQVIDGVWEACDSEGLTVFPTNARCRTVASHCHCARRTGADVVDVLRSKVNQPLAFEQLFAIPVRTQGLPSVDLAARSLRIAWHITCLDRALVRGYQRGTVVTVVVGLDGSEQDMRSCLSRRVEQGVAGYAAELRTGRQLRDASRFRG